MKAVKIENFVMMWYDECAISYAHISNAICGSDDIEQLKGAMEIVARDTEASKYFKWGYDSDYFWVKQRTEYMGRELQDTNTISVEFN